MIQAKDIMKVAGLTYRQVQYWDDQLINAHRDTGKKGTSNFRSFTVDDVFLYKAMSSLKKAGVSLQTIKKKYFRTLNRFVGDYEFSTNAKIVLIGDSIGMLHGGGGLKLGDNKLSVKELVDYDEILALFE